MASIALPTPSTNLVTAGPAHWAVLRLALPTVGAMLTQSIVNDIDIVFFAHLPCPESSNAQAALLPSLIILWLFGGSLSAISVGTQAFTARRFAEGKHADAGAVLANAAVFSILAGVVFSVLGYLTMPAILSQLVKMPDARAAADSYLRWRFLGVTSMATTFAFKAFFDGIGKTHVHLVSAVVMNVLNVVLCILLIFGFAPLHVAKMGIAGAGMAGFVSTYVGLFIMVGYALLPGYRRVFHPFSMKKLDSGLTWSILKLSIPSGLATVVAMVGFGLFAGIASRLDVIHPAGLVSPTCPGGRGEPVNSAATTVIFASLKLTLAACLAFGTSTATLVAQSLGEKDPDKAERFGWTSVKLGLAIFGTVGALEVIFARPILAFLNHSEIVQQAALNPLRLMGLCTPLLAVGMIVTQALFGAGNSRFVAIAEFVLHFTCLVPLAWFLGIELDLGLMGVWGAALIYVFLLASIMTFKFRSGDWKAIRI